MFRYSVNGKVFIPEHMIFPEGTPENLLPKKRKRGPRKPLQRRVFTYKWRGTEKLIVFKEGEEFGTHFFLRGDHCEMDRRTELGRRRYLDDRKRIDEWGIVEITNDQARIEDFFARWKAVLYKPLTPPVSALQSLPAGPPESGLGVLAGQEESEEE